MGYSGVYCKGGGLYIFSQSGRTGGWENCRAFFLCRGTAPGRGGPPWQAAVRRRFRSWLLGWGVFHEEEGGVCPLSVSIKQYACHVCPDLPGKPIFPPEAAAEAFTSRLMDRTELAAFIPCRHESGVCLIFIRRPAIHMFGKRTLPGSGQKGRPPWRAAVFRGRSFGCSGITVREERAVFFQSGRTGCWENCRVFFYAGARPPAGVDRRGRRRSGNFGVWFRFFS